MTPRITPINKDTAKALSAKGNAIRWARYRERKLAEERAASNEGIALRVADPTFGDRIKARVRTQIEAVLDSIEKEGDPQRLDKLASAFERLAEIERKLDMRPVPASIKTGSQDRKRDLPQPLPPAK